MFLNKRRNCHVYDHVESIFKLPFNLKKAGLYSLLILIFVACIQGTAVAQVAEKLSGYVTIDQNEVTYRTHEACLATQVAHGTAYTRCVVDSKLGGTTAGFGYNCGARVFTEIFGYWANNGYPDLMAPSYPSLPNGAVPDYSAQTLALFNLAGVEYTTYGDYSSYYGCHNCDTGMTAWADHHKSTSTNLSTKVAAYFTARGYSADVAAKNNPSYDEIKAELAAGRPVALAPYNCNHWVTVIGYDDSGPSLTALVGHESFISSRCSYLNTPMGVYEATFPFLPLSGNAVFVAPVAITSPPPVEPPPPPAVTYSVGGSITGLTKSGLTVTMATNGISKSILAGSTTYSWTGLDSGTYYDIHVVTNPTGLNCTVVPSHDGLAGSNITNVNITCKKITRKR